MKNTELSVFKDILDLLKVDLEDLLVRAHEIRLRRTSAVELCSILNAKSGACTEDCAFCAQSSTWGCSTEGEIVSKERALEAAYGCLESGISRLSLVTAGRTLSDREVDLFCSIYESLSGTGIGLCGSHGLLSEAQLRRLASSGVSRYHCNLETGRGFFREICSTHSIDDKIKTLNDARRAGLELCSGGLFGMGENDSHRAEMLEALIELKVDSVPINCLIPIKDTPMEGAAPLEPDVILRWGAIAQICMPWTTVRYAGGRSCLGRNVVRGLKGGIGGLLTGDYLTTVGSSVESDLAMIESIGLSTVTP